jgi:AcrR family transcriptional regulator
MTIIRKGEKTRADIVACAKQLFYQRGYTNTSFTDIVDASKLHRGNIYHYFKTKDDILNAVITQHLEDFGTQLRLWDSTQPDAKAKLTAFVDMITGRKLELVEYGCPIGTLNTELAKDKREQQQAARALFDLFRDWLAVCFRELGKSSEAEALALHLLGRAQGITLLAHVYHDTTLLENEINTLHNWIAEL